jgi:hypothetical protein
LAIDPASPGFEHFREILARAITRILRPLDGTA